jgi:hypothetical protein
MRKSGCSVTRGQGRLEQCKRKGAADQHWFSNQCRERRGETELDNVQKEECLRYQEEKLGLADEMW